MTYNNRMQGLNIIIFLTLVNAFAGTVYYILTLMGILPNQLLSNFLNKYAFSDILFVVIPSFIAALGMLKRKKWGWHSFILAGGAYLHSMGMILVEMIQKGKMEQVSFIPTYLIAFVLISIIYLWNYRYVIDFD